MGQISRPPEQSDPYPVKILGQMLLQNTWSSIGGIYSPPVCARTVYTV
jgi:hypothetical protein